MSDLIEPKSQKKTSVLFGLLFKTPNIRKFMEKTEEGMWLPSFSEYINKLCKDGDEVPERIIKRSNIERSFGHQLFKGTKNPSRDTVIQLAFGFKTDVEGAQNLLKYARKSALYPRVKRDAAIIYCLHNGFTLLETQTVLYDMKLSMIGRGKLYERFEISG